LLPFHDVTDDDEYAVLIFINETAGLIVPHEIEELFQRKTIRLSLSGWWKRSSGPSPPKAGPR
jgi:hypothetical protein